MFLQPARLIDLNKYIEELALINHAHRRFYCVLILFLSISISLRYQNSLFLSLSHSLSLSPFRHRDQSIFHSTIELSYWIETEEYIKVLALFSARVPADTSWCSFCKAPRVSNSIQILCTCRCRNLFDTPRGLAWSPTGIPCRLCSPKLYLWSTKVCNEPEIKYYRHVW